MRNTLDATSWMSLLSTLAGLVLVTLVAVGIRLWFMQTVQRRRERENRQINERLKTLIAAYKTLGGSFTGTLDVDPSHRRDGRRMPGPANAAPGAAIPATAGPSDATGMAQEVDSMARSPAAAGPLADGGAPGDAWSESAAERRRRIRDAVEAALADVVLLGTEAQVRLAAQAANDMVAGRTVQVGALVVSLRDFIRQALDLAPVPADVTVPMQGPLRVAAAGGARRGAGAGEGAGGGRGGGAGGGAGAGGVGMAGGLGMGAGLGAAAPPDGDGGPPGAPR